MDLQKSSVIASINQCIAQLRDLPDEPAQQAERKALMAAGTRIVKTAVADGFFSEEEETVYWDLLVLAFDPKASKGY